MLSTVEALPHDHSARVVRARLSFDGVSLGDAFGERFFELSTGILAAIEGRRLPRPRWSYTDDTVMALSVFEVLATHGTIRQDALVRGFVAKYVADPYRGYGPGAHRLLRTLTDGADWRSASSASFGATGSYGNGAAMRAAPVGAYFADDLERIAIEARRSAEVTHAHPEGIAGAVAVALAAGCAALPGMTSQHLVDAVLQHTPNSETRAGIVASREIHFDTPMLTAAGLLGSGALVSSQDTVPFVIWSAARHFESTFEDAMWNTLAGLGDFDTTCAMVGGILASRHAGPTLPTAWIDARESLATLAGLGMRARD
jgi:ADP-ribosylglycohydrolase